MTKIYVTKYALSSGPFSVEAVVHEDEGFATYSVEGGYYRNCYVHGEDFHLTKQAAMDDCERRRKAKLASIDKQRKKLESMKFEIED